MDKEGKPVDPKDFYAYYVDGELSPDYDPNHQESEQDSEQEQSNGKQSFWQKLFGKKNKDKNKPQEPKHEPVVEFKLEFDKFKDFIDIDKSYAVIQNPHAQSKAVYPGQKEDQTAVGTWTTSLRELFTGVSVYTAVTIKNHSNKAGTADVVAVEGIGGAQKVEDQN